MKLPRQIGPVWNLRLVRTAALLMFSFVLLLFVACLVAGRFTNAAVVAVSVLIFGFGWRTVRHITLRFERWAQRPGFRTHSLAADSG